MYQYKLTNIRVVDGDTIEATIDLGFNVLIREMIRLYGINTPECRSKDADEKRRGLAAKVRLKELIKQAGKHLRLKTTKTEKGKFGRVLGILEFNQFDRKGTAILGYWNINSTLVDEGHAVEYFGGKR